MLARHCVADWLAWHKIRGRVYTGAFSFSSQLSYERWPEVLVSGDGRDYVYGQDRREEQAAALESPAALHSYLRRYAPVDTVALRWDQASSDEEVEAWFPHREWALLYADDTNWIWSRRTPERQALIEQEEFRLLRPWLDPLTHVTPANVQLALHEAERALRNCGDGMAWARRWQAQAQRVLGR